MHASLQVCPSVQPSGDLTSTGVSEAPTSLLPHELSNNAAINVSAARDSKSGKGSGAVAERIDGISESGVRDADSDAAFEGAARKPSNDTPSLKLKTIEEGGNNNHIEEQEEDIGNRGRGKGGVEETNKNCDPAPSQKEEAVLSVRRSDWLLVLRQPGALRRKAMASDAVRPILTDGDFTKVLELTAPLQRLA